MKPTVAALALFGLLAVSVFASASQQQAAALSAIDFSTKDTLSSQNTLFQQVYEDSAPDHVTFLDATGSGTYNRQHYSNYALQFNGSDEYAQAGANTVFDITTGDASFWGYVYPTSVTGGDLWIVTKLDHGAATNDGYTVIRRNANLYVEFGDGTASRVSIEVSSAFTINTWHAWGVSFDRDGNMRGWVYNLNAGTYVTGSASIAGQQASASNTQTFTVARRSDAASGYLPGAMDQIYASMGTAISQTQFLEFAQSGTIAGLTATSAYYFNEGSGSTAYDEIASNNLTLQNSPTYVSNTPANSISTVAPAATTTLTGSGNTINSAAYMGPVDLSRYSLTTASASSQYVTMGDPASLDMGTSDWAIAGRVTMTTIGGFQVLVGKANTATASGAGYIIYANPSGLLTAELGDGSATRIQAVSNTAMTAGTAYTWGVSFDRDGLMNVYLNNNLVASTNISAQQLTASNSIDFNLSRNAASGGDFCNCNQDDVFVFNSIKSQAQFTSIAAGTLDTTNLISFWDANEGLGTNLDDRFGSNDGTLTNSPTYSSTVQANSLSRPTSYITGRDTATGKNGYGKINLSDLSEVADGYQTSSYYPRNIAQSTTSIYSPLYDNTANGNMRLGIQTRALASYSEPSIYTGSAGNPAHGVLMDTSAAASTLYVNLRSGSTEYAAEKVTSASTLVGKKIDRLTLYLAKTGAPTGNYQVGVWDVNGNQRVLYGTGDSAALTGSATAYTFLGSPYVIQANDYIGIKYNTGGSVGNTVDIYRSTSDVFDSTNSYVSFSAAPPTWNDNTSFDLIAVAASTSNVKIAVYDGSPDTEYVFFESGASSLAVVKYTNAASTISTSLSHTAGKDYSIMQMSGKILIQTSEATYTLNTSTDAITTDSNTYLTRPPQTFSISASARTYISTAYVANEETATLWNPSAGTSASDYVMIDTASAPTLTAYNPPKYYYLQTNDLTVEAASLTGTSWTIKQPGTQTNFAVTPYSEHVGISLVQNSTLFDEDVLRLVCDNGAYNINIPYFATGDDSDCNEWKVVADSSLSVGREIFGPFERTVDLVHTSPQTAYSFELSATDPTVFTLKSLYDGKIVDVNIFDASGQSQQRYLYGNCYTVQVHNNNNGQIINPGQICANDATTKTLNLQTLTIPTNWTSAGWHYNVTRSFGTGNVTTSNIQFDTLYNPVSYTAKVLVTDSYLTQYQTFQTWYNFTNVNATSTVAITKPNNSTLYFIVYDANMIPRLTVASPGSAVSLTAITSAFAPLGDLFGVPVTAFFVILGAAIFVKSNSPFGVIVVTAIAGFMFATGILSISAAAWGGIMVVAALGAIYAIKRF